MGDIEVEVWPAQGGRIVSLRAVGREWLVSGLRWTRMPDATTRFVDVEVSGWDEMFSTIDACIHRGLQVPDHGEAWSAAWHGDGGQLSFVSSTWGCVLHRTIAANRHRLRIDYRLTGDQQTDFLWSAHPLLLAPPGTRIELPSVVRSVIDVSAGRVARLIAARGSRTTPSASSRVGRPLAGGVRGDSAATMFSEKTSPDVVEEFRMSMLAVHRVGFRAMAEALAEDLRDALPRIDIPTLLVYGDKDVRAPLAVAETLRAAFSCSKLVVLTGAGHLCNVEAPRQFNEALRSFLLDRSD